MIWSINTVDQAFIDAWHDAGQPDQAVIDAYMATSQRLSPQKHIGIRRWYYLFNDNARIRLTTIGRPLEDFAGLEAKVIVGTIEIIGEFEGNREFVGKRGLTLQCQPIAWLQGDADEVFATGGEALAAISEQIIDREDIQRSQRTIKSRYEWRKP